MKEMIETDAVIHTSVYHSLCGPLTLGEYKGKLCLCDWNTEGRREHVDQRLQRILRAPMTEGWGEIIRQAIVQLDKYFEGQLQTFELPLLPCGTPFQHEVWQALSAIPYGSTESYAGLASRIGKPRAVRAVASAVGANPLALFLPCHRVVGSDGSLTGFAGGLPAKRFLLGLEQGRI